MTDAQCPAVMPLGPGIPCGEEIGHPGDHRYSDGPMTVTWSARLADILPLRAQTPPASPMV